MPKPSLLEFFRQGVVEPCQYGYVFPGYPNPPIPERCTSIAAGPVVLVVEARHLDVPGAVEDHGPTLHVCGAAGGTEYLRFDCFLDNPHYHYFQDHGTVNLQCFLDPHADGDAIEWTLACVRRRLPAMLEHCGEPELAAAVRAGYDQILAVVDDVERLLGQAGEQVEAERGLGSRE